MMTLQLHEAAGRTAYLAAFHAAQGLISEKTGRSAKTHRGVQTELHRLTMDDPRFDQELRAFLGRAYNLKTIADYETGPGAEVAPELAADAIAASKHFVARLRALTEEGPTV